MRKHSDIVQFLRIWRKRRWWCKFTTHCHILKFKGKNAYRDVNRAYERISKRESWSCWIEDEDRNNLVKYDDRVLTITPYKPTLIDRILRRSTVKTELLRASEKP